MDLEYNDTRTEGCSIVIVVPERAAVEPGYIMTLSEAAGGSAKHQFHAMAQMAYYQYQDEEIGIINVHEGVTLHTKESSEKLESGIVLYRDASGGLHVLASSGVNVKKLLETVHRFCTRWVRLDI